MTSTRRSFLHTLGIAAAGIAFLPHLDFLVPDNLAPYDGDPNLRWMLADSIALLAAELPADQFRTDVPRQRIDGLIDGNHQFGIDIALPEDLFTRYSKEQIRSYYLQPAMNQLAQEIRYRKVTRCFPMDLPKAVEFCGDISAPKHGLNLRFVRAWNPLGAPRFKRDEVTGELLRDANGDGIIERWGPPYLCHRFDMLVA